MVKTLMLVLTILFSTAWLMAQDPSAQGSSGKMGTTSASGQTAIEGCLQGSNGSFTLTDKAGTKYQLEGDTAKLSEHVGHEVQITGTTSDAGAAGSSASSTGSQTGEKMLTVEKVKHISKTCKDMGK